MTPDDLLEVWQGTPELHLLIDPTGTVVDANPVAVELGIHPGVRLGVFGDRRARSRLARLLRRASAGYRPSAELTLVLGGRRRTYRVQAVPLRNGDVALSAHRTPATHHQGRNDVIGRDPLTGLVDRTVLRDRLGLALRRAQRSGNGVGLMFLDIDDFKAINDRLGHAFGDGVLVGIAQRVSAVLRSVDTMARIGGDEFVIVCEDVASPADLDHLAKRVAQAVAEEPFVVASDRAGVSCSVGVAFTRTDGLDIDMFLRAADEAMYSAKRHGAGLQRSVLVEGVPDERSLGLQRALERGTLPFVVQPIRDRRTGQLVGRAVEVAAQAGARAADALAALTKHQPATQQFAVLAVRQALVALRDAEVAQLQVHVPLLALTDPPVRDELVERILASGRSLDDFVFAIESDGARSLRALTVVQEAWSGKLRLALLRFGADLLDLGALAALRPEVCELAPQLLGPSGEADGGRLRATCAAVHELEGRTQVVGASRSLALPGIDQIRAPLGETLQRMPPLPMER